MPKGKVTLAAVGKLARELPGVEESVHWGGPSWKVNGKMFACTPTHKSAEPDSLLVRVDRERRAEMLGADPETYYVKPHYEDYPSILVRLSRVNEDILRDLLRMGHKYVSQPATKKKRG